MPEMEAVKDAALKYDKKTLGRMAQLGQISSALAVLAGMMRDRIVDSEKKTPEKTVSEDIMGLEGFSDPTMAQQPVMQRAGGLTRIPIRDNMYEMAGGGIVAFQPGGNVSLESLLQYTDITPEERRQFERAGKNPAALPARVQEKLKEMTSPASDTGAGAGLGALVPAKTLPTPPTSPQPNALPSTAQQALSTTQEPPPAAPPAVPQAVDFDMSDEMKRLQDMRTQFMGEDPYSAYIKKLEESGKPTTSDKLLRALEFIEKGQRVREGDKAAFGELLTSEKAAKTAIADRERRIAEAKGREYTAKGDIFKTAYGKGEELAKEKRTEARDIAKEGRTEARDIAKEERVEKTRERLTRLEASLRRDPDAFNREIYKALNSKDPDERAGAERWMASKQSPTYKKMTEKEAIQAAQMAAGGEGRWMALKPHEREELIRQAKEGRLGMAAGDIDENNPLLKG